jgi:hypothetical protein
MKYGFVLPKGDARAAADLARVAEESGWDGFFVWEPVWGVDAWICLTAAAMQTETIRLGTMLTPLSRMRPWKLASETATLDNLSGGRVILAVGLGAIDSGFAEFGEETDRVIRAELLDEGLDIVTGLWRGQPFAYDGKHYTVRPTEFMPPAPPVQQPDGLLPHLTDGELTPDRVAEMLALAASERAAHAGPYDVIVEGSTPVGDAGALERARAMARAGAGWWIEGMWDAAGDDWQAAVRTRIAAGPPR